MSSHQITTPLQTNAVDPEHPATNVQNMNVRAGQLYEVLPDGRWAFFIDHHLIDSFNRCEQLFKYRHIMHIRAKGGISVAMAGGSWWSRTMELFYNNLANASREDILGYAAKAWIETKMPEVERADPKGFQKFARSISAIELLRAVGSQAFDKVKTLFQNEDGSERSQIPMGPFLMAGKYYDEYADVDRRNWRVIAAELGYGARREVKLVENSQVVVFYMGKPDIVVYSVPEDRVFPVDHKTVDRVEYDIQRKWKPHPQTAGYIAALNILLSQLGIYTKNPVDRTIINVAARSEPSDNPRDGKPKPRFTRVFPAYTLDEIEEWKRGILQKCARLRYCIENDEWVWKESGCHIYKGCEYRPIDSVTPNARPIVIKSSYNEVDPWIPYTAGEEDD